MKILAILTYYAPHWTGLTMHAQRVAEGLAARGHQVTVLTTRHSAALPRDELLNGVRVVRLLPLARISRGMISPAFPLAAARLIREHDVVQIHTPQLEALLVAGLCRLLRRPLLLTHHGDLVMPAGWFNQLVQRLVTGQMVLAGKLATAISAYSRDYAGHSPFLRRFAGKLSYIYPPVELPAPQPAEVERWRGELGLAGRPLVGFAGRFVEEKGFDYLLKAMPLVAAELPEARFVFAGEHHIAYEDFYGRCLPLIERNRGRIVELGLLRDQQRLANFYAMCDVFALPSRSDCLGMVQIESLLAGTPLVAADIPGARVVVRETGGGLLVAPHSPEALAAGLLAVLRQPAAYRISRAAVERVFSTSRTLSQYEAVFEALLAGRAEEARADGGARRKRR
ncbi:MAG TPA: glycosyltransferase family 4 protein [Herpetosiphonaceae bacterium]